MYEQYNELKFREQNLKLHRYSNLCYNFDDFSYILCLLTYENIFKISV